MSRIVLPSYKCLKSGWQFTQARALSPLLVACLMRRDESSKTGMAECPGRYIGSHTPVIDKVSTVGCWRSTRLSQISEQSIMRHDGHQSHPAIGASLGRGIAWHPSHSASIPRDSYLTTDTTISHHILSQQITWSNFKLDIKHGDDESTCSLIFYQLQSRYADH